jgi:general stress protein YciG
MNEKITKEDRKEAASILGKKGGKMNVKNNGKDHMSKIGKSGALKRWGKN